MDHKEEEELTPTTSPPIIPIHPIQIQQRKRIEDHHPTSSCAKSSNSNHHHPMKMTQQKTPPMIAESAPLPTVSFSWFSSSSSPSSDASSCSSTASTTSSTTSTSRAAGASSSSTLTESSSMALYYRPPPVIARAGIWCGGLCLFVLALIWPPLLLLVTMVAGQVIPYCFRVNDSAEMRRRMLLLQKRKTTTTSATVQAHEQLKPQQAKQKLEEEDENQRDHGHYRHNNHDEFIIEDDDDEVTIDEEEDNDDDSSTASQQCNDDKNNVPWDDRIEVVMKEAYWTNRRGMALSTLSMFPQPSSTSSSSNHHHVKALVCCCHGYSDHWSGGTDHNLKTREYQRLVKAGLGVIALDYEGHGRSDGTLCLIENWQDLIDDVSDYFQQAVASYHNQPQEQVEEDSPQPLPVFLMGESMGGAVAYSVYHRTPSLYRGVVFVSPMCKISEEMLPPAWMVRLLERLLGPPPGSSSSLSSSTSWLSSVRQWLGALPLAPSRGAAELCTRAHRDPVKAARLYACPTHFARRARLVTARTLLQATREISADFPHTFHAPFLVVHGRDDRVTDPRMSQALVHTNTASADKTLLLYEGLWHGITSTEPDAHLRRVFTDCIEWMLQRCNNQQSSPLRQ